MGPLQQSLPLPWLKPLVMLLNKGIARNQFSAEEQMSRNQKTKIQFRTDVPVDTWNHKRTGRHFTGGRKKFALKVSSLPWK